jgi:hypothetical protein
MGWELASQVAAPPRALPWSMQQCPVSSAVGLFFVVAVVSSRHGGNELDAFAGVQVTDSTAENRPKHTASDDT